MPWDFMKTGRPIQPQRRLGATNSVQPIDLRLSKELVRGHVGRRLAFRVPFGISGRDQRDVGTMKGIRERKFGVEVPAPAGIPIHPMVVTLGQGEVRETLEAVLLGQAPFGLVPQFGPTCGTQQDITHKRLHRLGL